MTEKNMSLEELEEWITKCNEACYAIAPISDGIAEYLRQLISQLKGLNRGRDSRMYCE